MSKARAKGTRWETELLDQLRNIWPHAERAPLRGTNDYGDFTAVNGWLLEAKSTNAPRFLEWARTCRRKALHGPWAVLWHGDRRTEHGAPLVLIDLDVFLTLVAVERLADRPATAPAATGDGPDTAPEGPSPIPRLPHRTQDPIGEPL